MSEIKMTDQHVMSSIHAHVERYGLAVSGGTRKFLKGGQEAKPTYGHGGGRRRYCDVCTSAVRLRRPLVCYTIAKTIQSLGAMSAAWGEATSKIIMVQPLKTIKKLTIHGKCKSS